MINYWLAWRVRDESPPSARHFRIAWDIIVLPRLITFGQAYDTPTGLARLDKAGANIWCITGKYSRLPRAAASMAATFFLLKRGRVFCHYASNIGAQFHATSIRARFREWRVNIITTGHLNALGSLIRGENIECADAAHDDYFIIEGIASCLSSNCYDWSHLMKAGCCDDRLSP